MKKYMSFMMVILLGLSLTAFGNSSGRNNNTGRPGNYNNNGNGNQNNRPGGNQNNRPGNNNNNNNNNSHDRNPGSNHNNGNNNAVRYCVEKKRNSDKCIRYENYNGGGQLPSKPPKL